MSWNEIAGEGNSTKLIGVLKNELIKKAVTKKKGVPKQGKASSARWLSARTHQEFIWILEILKAEDQDDMHRLWLASHVCIPLQSYPQD